MSKQTEAVTQQTKIDMNKQDYERRRRHFRDDYKRKVVSEVLSGKGDIDNFKDNEGIKISKYLIQRWKAEFRGQKFTVDAVSHNRDAFSRSNELPKADIQPPNDYMQELLRLRNENERLKQIIAIDLGINSKYPAQSYAR